jgi:hypothetical protein
VQWRARNAGCPRPRAVGPTGGVGCFPDIGHFPDKQYLAVPISGSIWVGAFFQKLRACTRNEHWRRSAVALGHGGTSIVRTPVRAWKQDAHWTALSSWVRGAGWPNSRSSRTLCDWLAVARGARASRAGRAPGSGQVAPDRMACPRHHKSKHGVTSRILAMFSWTCGNESSARGFRV